MIQQLRELASINVRFDVFGALELCYVTRTIDDTGREVAPRDFFRTTLSPVGRDGPTNLELLADVEPRVVAIANAAWTADLVRAAGQHRFALELELIATDADATGQPTALEAPAA